MHNMETFKGRSQRGPQFDDLRSYNGDTNKYKGNELENIYSNISNLMAKFDKMEKINTDLQNQIQESKTRENKLLNRFSWLILIINYSLVIIMLIAVVLFINSIYPFIKDLMENDTGVKVIVGLVGGAIGTGIIGIWLTFNKYVNKVIEREKSK